MTTAAEETELEDQLERADRAIESAICNARGIADIAQLPDESASAIRSEVERTIEEYEEALLDDDEAAEWLKHDRVVSVPDLGRLLKERHEIEEKILDRRDERLPETADEI